MQFLKPLKGIVPPVITPLLDGERLDTESLGSILEGMIAAGCSGVFVLGTTGEAQALSNQMRVDVVRAACGVVRGRIPVLVGISDTAVSESVRLGRAAADLGADAVVFTPPYYQKVGQEDVVRFSKRILAEVPLPAFLYNIPSLTKTAFSLETADRLLDDPRILGFKDSSGDLIFFLKLLELAKRRQDFSVLVGPEEMLPEVVAAGGHGGVTGGANLIPSLYVDLYQAAARGDSGAVARLRTRVLEISSTIYRLGEPETSYIRGLKTAMRLMGLCSGLPAAPLAPASDDEIARIDQALQRIGLLSPVERRL